MAEIILPSLTGIGRVEAYRARAEVTHMRFAHWEPARQNPNGTQGGWTYDNNELEIPNHPSGAGYAFADARPFSAPRQGSVRLLVTAQWSNGATWLGVAKEETFWFTDRIELLFYTGLSEGWNTRVTLYLSHRSPGTIDTTITNHVLVDVGKTPLGAPVWN